MGNFLKYRNPAHPGCRFNPVRQATLPMWHSVAKYYRVA